MLSFEVCTRRSGLPQFYALHAGRVKPLIGMGGESSSALVSAPTASATIPADLALRALPAVALRVRVVRRRNREQVAVIRRLPCGCG